ncbi:MAG: hypothetical protein ACRD1A_04415 [Terriglobales bacterium]
MARMIQIRHVPETVHRRLKAKAKAEGLSPSDFLRREVERVAVRPTLAEIRARLATLPPIRPRQSPAERERELSLTGAGAVAAPSPRPNGYGTPARGPASPSRRERRWSF